MLRFIMFEDIAQHIPHQVISYKNVAITIKRLDQVHPQISGNKFFKLKYNFLEAQQLGFNQILTFGGAYSNHIAATAYAAQRFGFKSVGIIRGDELANKPLNPTLETAKAHAMFLSYVSREKYRLKETDAFRLELKNDFPNHYIIPEGGTNALAIQGCKEILKPSDLQEYDLICCAVGTGGTIAGLIESADKTQTVLGFSALKGDFLRTEVEQLTQHSNWHITDEYCCGGYAKTTANLIEFMQLFEKKYQIPLEHIYTAKMMMGIFDLIDQGKIQSSTRLLVIHTGGLQGRLR